MDIRFGNGFDVHRFTKGNTLRLCGIDIDFNKKLQGHSDADVALHAVTDSILGALALGDIGRWFPPSEAKWKNVDSSIFLDFAHKKSVENNFKISNIDLTIICENPKITPYASLMKKVLANLLNSKESQINIKATTTENLGFTGRQEGIAALCTVALISR